MTTPTHPELVRALVKPPREILQSVSYRGINLIHAAMGVSGEAGELLDAIKKHAIYDQPLNRENVIEELGDLEFFMEMMRQELGIARDETLAANVAKLSVRYKGGRYSDGEARERRDKKGAKL